MAAVSGLSPEKRLVSVGFIIPKPYEFRGDNIYVALIPHGDIHSIRVESASAEDFFYNPSREPTKRESGKQANNLIFHSAEGTPVYQYYWEFIKMLAEENNGKIDEERMVTDGLTLAKLVQDTHYSTGIVKTF